ncbi:MAG: S-layer homology domain-containing protein [Candidatus Metalachnospira sp.]|nr:S-layer homology domain-containing protein [Candidatus Metalachnospira sp.]
MRKKLIAIIAAALAVCMSVPAFAHQVSVVRGTDNKIVVETPVSDAEHKFTDVSKEDNGVVNIAYKNGEVVGITDTTLGANENITMQDFCIILWNMADCPSTMGRTAYNANSADKYAVAAVKWAVSNSIISGTADTHKALTVSEVKAMLDKAGYDVSSIEDSDKEVTKIDSLRMIVKTTKRDTIMLMADLDHDEPKKQLDD